MAQCVRVDSRNVLIESGGGGAIRIDSALGAAGRSVDETPGLGEKMVLVGVRRFSMRAISQ